MVSRRMLSTPSIVRRGHLSLRNPRSHAWLGLGLGLGLVFLRGRCLAAGRCSDSSTSLSSRPCDATTTLVITHTPPVRRSKTGARAPSLHLEGHHAMDTMPPAVKHKGARRRQVHRPSHRRAARAAALRVRPGACFTRRSAQLRRGTVGRPRGWTSDQPTCGQARWVECPSQGHWAVTREGGRAVSGRLFEAALVIAAATNFVRARAASKRGGSQRNLQSPDVLAKCKSLWVEQCLQYSYPDLPG